MLFFVEISDVVLHKREFVIVIFSANVLSTIQKNTYILLNGICDNTNVFFRELKERGKCEKRSCKCMCVLSTKLLNGDIYYMTIFN